MKDMSKRFLLGMGLILEVITGPLLAVEVSAPLGARRVEIRGAGATTIVSAGGFRSARAYAGTGSLSGTRLVCPSANWAADAWGPGYFVELETGEWSAIVRNTVSELELEAALMEGTGIGFRIFAFSTLDRLFGPANGAGFTGGRHIGEADILIRWDNASQETAGLAYFNTDAGQWLDAFNEPAGDTILYPDECLIVSGVGADHEILLAGTVTVSLAMGGLAGDGATNLVPNPFVFDVPIESSGLEAGLTGGPDIGSADFLAIFDPAHQLVTRLVYFNTRDQAWRDSFNRPLTAADVIPAGSGVIAVRHSVGTSEWRLAVPGEIEFTQGP